jgi:DNA-binding winged helix-turn-helix (wHTH) protein/TolB-like protein
MAPDHTLQFESGDLNICPELGEVRNSRGESARLAPVSMKVLMLLIGRAGQVVSRSEVFETVWKNQVIGDDTLTRAISDIRGLLRQLSAHDAFIETIPKRGYRWIAQVRQVAIDRPANGAPSATALPRRPWHRRAPIRWLWRGLAYAAVLVLIASAGVSLMERFARPGLPVVAVLPTQAEASQRELAARIEEQISAYLIRLDRVALLSRTAIESRPSNPFPYFYYEFGARWLVESELRLRSGQISLSIALVDARTGIVLFQSTELLDEEDRPGTADIEDVFKPLAGFIVSQQAP